MQIKILIISLVLAAWWSTPPVAFCQSFFWSNRGPDSIQEAPVADFFAVDGVFEEATFYFYFRNEQDLDTGAFIMMNASSGLSIISANTYDFPVRTGGVQIDTRLGASSVFGPGEIINDGQEATIFAARFGMSGFGLVSDTTGPIFIDDGYVSSVDAFLFGKITISQDTDNIATLPGEITTSMGYGGIVHQGMMVDVTFGSIRIEGCPLSIHLGDINNDQLVDLYDVAPFVDLLASGISTCESDVNQDGVTDLLDVEPFIDIMRGN